MIEYNGLGKNGGSFVAQQDQQYRYHKPGLCELSIQTGRDIAIGRISGIQVMVKAGDVFAIKTANGDAYFQFVKKIAPMGSLIRVLPGTFPDQPPEWDALIDCETNFWIFFPVAAALKQGIVRKVVHCPIPEHACKPPVFRAGVVDPSTGKVETWWLMGRRKGMEDWHDY